jgi:hypothetical protein
MSNIRNAVLGLLVAGASLGAAAQTAAEHTQHHPAGSPSPSTSMAAPSPQGMGMGQMAGMEQQMKAMQAMHEKMVAAQTPTQRQALMAEHMKLMQDGMAMMGGSNMGGMGGMQGPKAKPMSMSDRQQMMEMRMEMMQSMMQMMMDRMPTPATP